jgi:hypothetical protein
MVHQPREVLEAEGQAVLQEFLDRQVMLPLRTLDRVVVAHEIRVLHREVEAEPRALLS